MRVGRSAFISLLTMTHPLLRVVLTVNNDDQPVSTIRGCTRRLPAVNTIRGCTRRLPACQHHPRMYTQTTSLSAPSADVYADYQPVSTIRGCTRRLPACQYHPR